MNRQFGRWFITGFVLFMSFWTAGCGGGGDVPLQTPPDAPTGVTASAVSASGVGVSWHPVPGATGYNIYSAETPAVELTPANKLNTLPVKNPVYSDTSVLAGNSTYYYRVTAVNQGGESEASSEASATTGPWKIQQAPGMDTHWALSSVAWSGTEFTAVGEAGTVYTSPTGSTWTPGTSGTIHSFHRVRWLNGRYIAVADSREIHTSANGSSWTQRLASSDNIGYWGIAWSGAAYLVTGMSNTDDAGTQATSGDGLSWNPGCAAPASSGLLDVVWSSPSGTNSAFVAVGLGLPGSILYGTVYSSADGTSWSSNQIAEYKEILRGIAWSGRRYVAVGDYGVIYTSSDGGSWTKQTSGTTWDLRAITWTGRRFIAVGGSFAGHPGAPNSVILTSRDGINWVSHDSGTTAGLNEIVWSGSNYVIVGDNATILSN